MSGATFTHTTRPANVNSGEYSNQRRFGAPGEQFGMAAQHDRLEPQRNRFNVFRDAEHDVAEVTLELGLQTRASITLRMTPAELRRAAAAMIDAAQDIEALPAAVLYQLSREGLAQ